MSRDTVRPAAAALQDVGRREPAGCGRIKRRARSRWAKKRPRLEESWTGWSWEPDQRPIPNEKQGPSLPSKCRWACYVIQKHPASAFYPRVSDNSAFMQSHV